MTDDIGVCMVLHPAPSAGQPQGHLWQRAGSGRQRPLSGRCAASGRRGTAGRCRSCDPGQCGAGVGSRLCPPAGVLPAALHRRGGRGRISPESLPLLRRQKAAVLLAGPGLGYTAQSTARAAETRTLIQQLLSGFAGCAVLDADGLNAAAGLLSAGQPPPHPAGALVLTPHPGEMARLTGLSTGAVNADREGIARRFAQQWDAVVLLKGMRTIIAAPDGRCFVNPSGNPGLARGGSGDALAGILAALLACGLEAAEAASCAAWLHGAAADRAAAQRGEYGMLPHDLFPALGTLFAENGR